MIGFDGWESASRSLRRMRALRSTARASSVVPAQPGIRLAGLAAARALLHAALKRRPDLRVAQLPVQEAPAKLSTEAARAMHIRAQVSAYTTYFGGVPNRIHNVELVSHLVDQKLIAPGATFSFNKTTGDRNAAKGFLVAPVIVNGELTTGLGGGVCQVSTTVFNAAFEAGLKITERTNHALYISHYPQGRDATVNYPDVDLQFVNDTGNWMLLRTFVSSSSLTVGLYGTPVHRKVTSTTSPLVSHGVPPVKKTIDPSLKPGEKVVDDPGLPAMTTSVTRDVYEPERQAALPRHLVFVLPRGPGARANRPRCSEEEAARGRYDDDNDVDDVDATTTTQPGQ